MLPSELYALIKARDAAKEENAHKESSIAMIPSSPVINKEANFTMKHGSHQRRNKKGKFHENRAYDQRRPSREYVAKLKQEFGDNYIECSHCN